MVKKQKIVKHGTWRGTEKQWETLRKRLHEQVEKQTKALDIKIQERKKTELEKLKKERKSLKEKIKRLGNRINDRGDYETEKKKEKARKLKHKLFSVEEDITEIKENLGVKRSSKKQSEKIKNLPSFEEIITGKIMNIMERFDTYVFTKWEQHKADLIKERLGALLAGAGKTLDEIAKMLPELEREIEQFIVDSEETYEDSLNENNSSMTTRSWNRIITILGISERDFEEYVTFSD